MDQLDDLEKHVNELVVKLSEIIQRLQKDIADAKKAVSFDQVKEIENSIGRMKRQGIPVPSELKALKIRLLSEHELHQARIALFLRIQESIAGSLDLKLPQVKRTKRILRSQTGNSSNRKPANYERPLGIKGYSNLEDYLIPVIRLMWSGLDHKSAFRKIAQKLDVRYNTVSAQCTRTLGMTTDEFIRQVKSKSIVDLLERKYPDQYLRIKAELKS